jgi:DNA-binding CsgD family transcriptional regulator
MFHTKLYAFHDGRAWTIWTGSANASMQAFGANEELMLRARGTIVSPLIGYLARLKKDGKPFKDAATELRRLAAQGMLEQRTTDAVLMAAGHGEPPGPTSRRREYPGGLSGREVEVLGLAAKGLTTRAIADRLFISPKTADHHIQHVYTKIGVSTRAAAALWAMQHAVVR